MNFISFSEWFYFKYISDSELPGSGFEMFFFLFTSDQDPAKGFGSDRFLIQNIDKNTRWTHWSNETPELGVDTAVAFTQWWANILTYWSVRRQRQYFRPMIEISKDRNFSKKFSKRFKPKHRPKSRHLFEIVKWSKFFAKKKKI